jgi:hypothetical protein
VRDRVIEAVEAMARRGLLSTGYPYSREVEARVRRIAAEIVEDLVSELLAASESKRLEAERNSETYRHGLIDWRMRAEAAEASLREAVVHIRALILLRRDHLEDGMKDCDECSEGAQDAEAFLARVGGGSPG